MAQPPLPPPPPSPPPGKLYVDTAVTGPRAGYSPSDVVVNGVHIISDQTIVGTGGQWAMYTRGTPTKFVHCEISGQFLTAVGLGDNLTFEYCDIHDFTSDAVKMGNNSHILYSWIHDCNPAPNEHADGVQVQNGIVNSSILYSVIDMGSKYGNAAIFISPDLGPNANGPVEVAYNYLSSGGYTLYVVDGNNGTYHQGGVNVHDNVFGTYHRYGFTRITEPSIVFTNNTREDTGALLVP